MKKREGLQKILSFGIASRLKIHFGIFAIIFLFIGNTYAMSVSNVLNKSIQSVVTGTVTDEAGTPLPGANVIEKGTTNGVITEFDGNYSIEVSGPNAVLVFNSLGFAAVEATVGSNSTVNIKLSEDAQSLDEVVVVGYGTQKKSDVTGSVTSLSKERLSQLPVTNAMQSVQGAVAGVNVTQSSSAPRSGTTAQIRGASSISASTGPFIVLDGYAVYDNNKVGNWQVGEAT
jgi:hypothetical protein